MEKTNLHKPFSETGKVVTQLSILYKDKLEPKDVTIMSPEHFDVLAKCKREIATHLSPL